jgi:ergothioneine biosynthesis protein EgtB
MAVFTASDASSATGSESLAPAFERVRSATRALAAPLSAEDQCVQPTADASPTKWHLAHTTWFFETFVLPLADPSYRPHDDRFAFLFNSYYEAVGPRQPRPRRGMITRPTVAEVHDYRDRVDEIVRRTLRGPLSPELRARVVLGLEHEMQHQELLLTDALEMLAANPTLPTYRAGDAPKSSAQPPLHWIERPEGVIEIGHRDTGHDGANFCFDNERPRHRAFVERFAFASRLVTNGEWLAFIDDGGYRTPSLWLSDGWATVQANGWRAPHHWIDRGGAWHRFGLRGLRAVDVTSPVAHVSFYEADAFARWSRARLPTEQEWELVATHARAPLENVLETAALEPRPLASDGDPSAVHQLFGDVWEWTGSPYVAYPRYRPLEGALGEYNGKFMCNQMVLRGASCFTPGASVRATYRNFFPPAARWQATGLRLAKWV